uniref:VWFA domain-containing protein n=1 Tax=Meloidogyne incognita TaxID=6306 RepID=A0A914KTK7_MELIC
MLLLLTICTTFFNNNIAQAQNGGTITIKDKYIKKWRHSKTGIVGANSGANSGANISKNSTTNLKSNFVVNKEANTPNTSKNNRLANPSVNSKINLKNTTTNTNSYSTTNLGKLSNSGIQQKQTTTAKPILKNAGDDSYGGVQGAGANLASLGASPVKSSSPSYSTITTTLPPISNPPSVPSQTPQNPENYANEVITTTQVSKNNAGAAAQTLNPSTKIAEISTGGPSTLYPPISPSIEYSPSTPSPYISSNPPNYNQQNSNINSNPAPNYNQAQYALPPAISPYEVKPAQDSNGEPAVPSGDAYEASVLEQTAGVTVTTTIIPTTETLTTTIRTTTRVPPCGPDVLFVLDSTGSVRNVYEAQRGYILDVVQQMDIASDGQHVGLIIYSSKLRQRIVVNLDESLIKEQFLKIVHELPYHGGITATGAALSLTIKALEKRRPSKRTLVILLTDGFTYDDWEEQSRTLLSKGVEVIVAGDVQSYLRPVLDKIAGDPSKVLLGQENKPKVLDYLRCR